MHDEFNEHEWTVEERAMFASLPEERIPPAALKTRTREAIRRSGLIATQTVWAPRRALALIAAASLIFVAGALIGYAMAQRSAKRLDDARVANRQEVARAVSDTNSQPKRHVVWY